VKGKPVAVFREGDVSATLTGDIDEVERALAPIVAAAPGYVRLHYYIEGDDGSLIERTPVVTWRITGNGSVPVSPGEDVPWFSDAVGMQLPDGRIDASVSAPHDDEKSWLRTVAFLAKAKGKAVA
jgi:hypothetical protein